MARLQAGNIGVEVFQSESKLVAIDPLRAPSELRALEPSDDELKSLDLGLRYEVPPAGYQQQRFERHLRYRHGQDRDRGWRVVESQPSVPEELCGNR